ncbi:hypothetical protein CsSME_00014789 [Camellia sinensis var. sinensis]
MGGGRVLANRCDGGMSRADGVRKMKPFCGLSNGPQGFEGRRRVQDETPVVSVFPNGPTCKGENNGPRMEEEWPSMQRAVRLDPLN